MALLLVATVLAGCAANPQAGGAVPAGEAQGAVYNASSGAWYDDIESAFAEAGGGDALYAYADLASGGLAPPAGGFSLDLQGHALSIDAVGSGARGGQGLAHSGIAFGAGEYAVSNGSIAVTVGAQPETTQSAASAYCGVSTEVGGSLALSNVELDVAYSGTSTIMPGVALVGVEAGGSLSLDDGSAVTVESAPARGVFGASTVAGVHAMGLDGACDIALQEGSSIAVDNRSAQVMQGALGYPSAVFGTTKTTNSELMEIAVDPALDWYDDLCARFLANARYDDREDADGFMYGAEVYYASPLELENGLNVWAFTDPMGAGAAGYPENIVPTHVFVRSDYALPLDAYGIWCESGFGGSVSSRGAISATTTSGHAIGVYQGVGGSYDLDEETIEAACGGEPFRAAAGPFDLGDYVDVPTGPDVPVSYPAKSSYVSVRQESPVAWAAAVSGEEPWAYAPSPIAFDDLFTEWDLYGEAPAEGETMTTIGLSLTYYRMGQDGYLYTGEEAGTYVYSPELDLIDVANERIAPGDVVEIGGIENVFLGWSPRVSDKQPLYTEHILLEKQNWGSFGAKCALYGIYEAVPLQASDQGQAQPVADGAAAAAGEPSGQMPTTLQATGATAATDAGGQLPSGGLDVGAQPAEAFSPAGGVAVIGGVAVLLALACLLWLARGRKLVSLEAQAPGSQSPSWEEMKRKEGIRF